MNEITAWEVVNALCRVAVALVVIIKLAKFFDQYQPGERVGLGIAGGCALLTVPAVMFGPASPFYEWAGAAFAFGVLVYFLGRLKRQFRHDWRNAAQVRQARERR